MILGTLKDLDEAHIGDWDLNMALHNYLSVLDENYGQDRNIYEDDGGFAIIIEDEEQLQEASAHVDLEGDIIRTENLSDINHYREFIIAELQHADVVFIDFLYVLVDICFQINMGTGFL